MFYVINVLKILVGVWKVVVDVIGYMGGGGRKGGDGFKGICGRGCDDGFKGYIRGL